MVLDNATTAMTGTQPHPGTGQTLMGPKNAPLSIERVLNANGFNHVYHANPLDKDSSIVAVKAAISYEGPSAVIFESPCIQLSKPGEPVVIDVEKCTGCKKCITSIGCPAIGFDPKREGPRSKDRGQAFIDPALCNGCDLCGKRKGLVSTPSIAELDSASMPQPPQVLDVLESAAASDAARRAESAEAAKDEPVDSLEAVEETTNAVEEAVIAAEDSAAVVEEVDEPANVEVDEIEALDEVESAEEAASDEVTVDEADDTEATADEAESPEPVDSEADEVEQADEPDQVDEVDAADQVEVVDEVEQANDVDSADPMAFLQDEVIWGDSETWSAEPVESNGQMGYKPLKLGEGHLINTVTLQDELRASRADLSSRMSSVFGGFGKKKKKKKKKGSASANKASDKSQKEGGPDA